MIPAACAGFLLAVLWMDLIFDSQVLRHRRADVLPESVVESIAGYYRRATTTSRPMNLLIALVMLILLGALAFRWLGHASWPLLIGTALAVAPVLLAAVHTVPAAKRLGRRTGSQAEQSRLARAICRDHFVCLVLVFAFLAIWVLAAA